MNQLLVAADGNIDSENGPGDDEFLKLCGLSHGWGLLREIALAFNTTAPRAEAQSGAASAQELSGN
jgi:hypothetical protein